MRRLKLKHHKAVMSLTVLLLIIISAAIASKILYYDYGIKILLAINFSLLMLLLVVSFVSFSVILRIRDELNEVLNKKRRKH